MWICPACDAINYNRGPCQCCGYGRQKTIQGALSTTDTQLPPQKVVIS